MNTVLVIDDDRDLRRAVRFALTAGHLDTLEAESATDGLAHATQFRPDLILCDHNLGQGNGLDVLGWLRQNPATATIPLILITGSDDASVMRRGMDLGADDYLHKPFTGEELLAAVQARLRKHATLKAEATSHALRDLEARHRLLFEHSTDAVMALAPPSWAFVEANAATLALFAAPTKTAFLAATPWDLSPETQPDGICSAARARTMIETAMRVGSHHFDWTHRRLNGELFPATVLLTRIELAGQITHFLAVKEDITERKQSQRERDLMELHLRQAQKLESIGQLAAGIAHEINTPMQYIGDNTRFLQDAFADLRNIVRTFQHVARQLHDLPGLSPTLAPPDLALQTAGLDDLLEEIPQAIEQTLQGAERVTNIVRAMKEFSHPGTDQKTPVDLNHAIASTVTVARNEWKYVADLVTDLDPLLPPVPCLPGEFNQVVLNLIVNAAHAIADATRTNPSQKGRIAICTRRVDPFAEIRIEDSGTGIPDHIRNRIFDPFFTTKPVGQGSGQGLAIARSVIVDKHGGTLTFDSVLGQGTTFLIRLPLTAPDPRP